MKHGLINTEGDFNSEAMWKDVRSITETIGPRIKYLRLARGLSQGDLQRKYNIPRPYISSVEHGHKVPSLESAIRIAKAISVPPWLLFMTTEEFEALCKNGNGTGKPK